MINQSITSSIRVAILILSICLAFVIALDRTSAARSQSPAPAAQQKPAEKTIDQAQKNIQVLKGIPQSQLIPMMNYMSASLGVKCIFCHVNKDNNWDFASDEKGEKKTARAMITMVLEINKTNFRGNTEVTCFTCHRGRSSPVGTPTLPLPEPSPRPEGNQGAQQQPASLTADQLLEKYTQALGGDAAIAKLKSRVMKGTVTTAAGLSLGYELYQSAPDKVLAVITSPQGTTERGFDGSTGWDKGQRGVRDLGGSEVYYLRRYPDPLKDIRLKEQFSRMQRPAKTRSMAVMCTLLEVRRLIIAGNDCTSMWKQVAAPADYVNKYAHWQYSGAGRFR